MNEQTTTTNAPEYDRDRLAAISDMASAYLSNNPVQVAGITEVIGMIATSVDGLLKGATAATPTDTAPTRGEPAVSIKKSVTPDHIVSLFDGRKFKSLKRYLATQHNMTPEQYRAHWGLPHDYPMVAPNYAAARSALAKQMGLGQGGRRAKATAPKAPGTRGRKKAA